MHRRHLLAAIPSGLALVAFAGCAVDANGNIVRVPVTLAGAQAEASAILASVQAAVAALGATAPAAIHAALADAGVAVAAFVGLPANATPAQYAAAVVRTVSVVIAGLALSPAVALAINAGLMLISGLVAGLPSVAVPAAVVTKAPVAAVPGRVSAPIPIPAE